MFYQNNDELAQFTAAVERAKQVWGDGIVTALEPATEFYRGEEYHQDFFAKNPGQGYCNAVVLPKMLKVRSAFTQYLRTE